MNKNSMDGPDDFNYYYDLRREILLLNHHQIGEWLYDLGRHGLP